MAFFCKKIIIAKSKDVKTGSNLAGSSKEGYGSKRGVLSMMMMMMMMMLQFFYCNFCYDISPFNHKHFILCMLPKKVKMCCTV
jgi:hypothetical protein